MKNLLSFLYLMLFLQAVHSESYTRIVSLAPSLTKHIVLLSSEKNIVGCTNYCPIKSNTTVVANALNVNFEQILKLKPDIIITTDLTSPEIIAGLKKLKLNIRIFPLPSNFELLCKEFIEVGTLVGHKKEAESIVNKSKQDLVVFQQSIKTDKKPVVFIEIGAKPLFGAIDNTFMADYIRYAGGLNALASIKNGAITRESVLKTNPDAIFIVTMGVLGDEEKNVWLAYKNMKASKNNSIFLIDPDMSCSPTPPDFVEITGQMIKCIYK